MMIFSDTDSDQSLCSVTFIKSTKILRGERQRGIGKLAEEWLRWTFCAGPCGGPTNPNCQDEGGRLSYLRLSHWRTELELCQLRAFISSPELHKWVHGQREDQGGCWQGTTPRT